MNHVAHFHAKAYLHGQPSLDDRALPGLSPADQARAEMLTALALAPSLPCLWSDIRAYGRTLGCSDLSLIDLEGCGQTCAEMAGAFMTESGTDALRQAVAASGGEPVLRDSQTVIAPAFGPRGLEAILMARLAHAVTSLPVWTRDLTIAFQLAYARYRQLNPKTLANAVTLSQREREIMLWVTHGKSNAVIGLILGISAGTVDTYMRRIFRKLDVADRTSAAMRAKAIGAIA